MCHALRDRSAQPTLHACALPLCSYLLHTGGSLSTTGIEPDSVPTARLPESEPEQCHTCSLCTQPSLILLPLPDHLSNARYVTVKNESDVRAWFNECLDTTGTQVVHQAVWKPFQSAVSSAIAHLRFPVNVFFFFV